MSDLTEIDGSVLEGGGQILRMSISLSAILGKPVRVTNIRAGRKNPGLAPQHLKGINLVSEMCQGQLKGNSIGSTEIEFRPGKLRGGHYTANTHTAGSISLLLQVALPCALMADGPVTLDLIGGTNVSMAPQIDYMIEVFRHTLKKFGADFDAMINRRGYFPKGGGHVSVEINPVKQLRSIDLTERGKISKIYGWSFVAGNLPVRLAKNLADSARHRLKEYGSTCIQCYQENKQISRDNFNTIILACEFTSGQIIGSDDIGRAGVTSLKVGLKAAEELAKVLDSGASVDNHTQDQIIIYMALAEGKSKVRVGEITLHTKTAIHIAELIANIKFNIQQDGQQNIIECLGLGFSNINLVS